MTQYYITPLPPSLPFPLHDHSSSNRLIYPTPPSPTPTSSPLPSPTPLPSSLPYPLPSRLPSRLPSPPTPTVFSYSLFSSSHSPTPTFEQMQCDVCISCYHFIHFILHGYPLYLPFCFPLSSHTHTHTHTQHPSLLLLLLVLVLLLLLRLLRVHVWRILTLSYSHSTLLPLPFLPLTLSLSPFSSPLPFFERVCVCVCARLPPLLPILPSINHNS